MAVMDVIAVQAKAGFSRGMLEEVAEQALGAIPGRGTEADSRCKGYLPYPPCMQIFFTTFSP